MSYRLDSAAAQKKDIAREIDATQRQIDQLLDRNIEAGSGSVIAAYEKRIDTLEARKAELTEQGANWGQPVKGFEETFRTAMSFLVNPWKLWLSGRLENKRAVLKLAFADRLSYMRGEGFRTANPALPFKALGQFCGSEMEMARPAGFEPATVGLEGRWSELGISWVH